MQRCTLAMCDGGELWRERLAALAPHGHAGPCELWPTRLSAAAAEASRFQKAEPEAARLRVARPCSQAHPIVLHRIKYG